MKKGHFIIFGLYFLLAATAACNNASSIKDKLRGEWKHIKEVTDANNNGILDSGDTNKDLTGEELFIIFNSTGTLIVSYNGTSNADNPGENKWSLENGNTYLKIVNKTDSSSTTALFHIDEFTSNKMTLRDTSGGVTIWNVWEKRD